MQRPQKMSPPTKPTFRIQRGRIMVACWVSDGNFVLSKLSPTTDGAGEWVNLSLKLSDVMLAIHALKSAFTIFTKLRDSKALTDVAAEEKSGAAAMFTGDDDLPF